MHEDQPNCTRQEELVAETQRHLIRLAELAKHPVPEVVHGAGTHVCAKADESPINMANARRIPLID